MRSTRPKSTPSVLALCAALAMSPACALEYWSEFSTPATDGTSGSVVAGTLHGTPITVNSVGSVYQFIRLDNGVAWGNSTAGIYPASFSGTVHEFVRSLGTTTTAATPSMATLDFGQPLIDPVLIFYSLDNSSLTVAGTQTTAGATVVNGTDVTITANQPSMVNGAALAVTGPYAAGAAQPFEGCVAGSNRVCGMFQFKGSYSQLKLGQYGNARDGVGFQVGIGITPGAGNETPFTGPQGTAAVAVADVRANDQLTGLAGTTVPATAGNTTVAPDGSWPAGITLDPSTGAVSVAASAAAGSYSLSYKLCDVVDPNNCVSATLSITLQAPPPVNPPVTPPVATPVPTLGQWALALLGAALAAGGLRLRRRQA